MPRKSFSTSGKAGERSTVEFDLDGVTLYARRPKMAVLLDLADVANRDTPEQVSAAMRFVDDCLLPGSADHLNARLYDPDDDLEIDDLVPILRWLMEEFTARPTTPPKPSQGPSQQTGRRSTARRRPTASTSSPSTSTEVSTSLSA